VTYGKSELQETRRGKLIYGKTDQKPASRGGRMVARWDGKIRNFETKKTYLNSSRVRIETPADRIGRELKREPYSFF